MNPNNEKVILITGSTDGLGKLVAQDLAALDFTILLHGRNRKKGEAALREIQKATGNQRLFYYNADFSSLDAVQKFADEILANYERLDGLVNHAGVGSGQREAKREISADGYELHFAVNYLAPYLLTQRLLPLLRRSAPARIVNVSSIGQNPIDFDDVMLAKGYEGSRAYRQSKLAQVMFTFDLAAELKGTGVTVNSLHPASLMNTKMVLESNYFAAPLTTVQQGAEAVEFLAASPELDGVTGEFFDGMQRARANPQAYDPEARRRLRALSEQLIHKESVNGSFKVTK